MTKSTCSSDSRYVTNFLITMKRDQKSDHLMSISMEMSNIWEVFVSRFISYISFVYRDIICYYSSDTDIQSFG